MPSVTPIRRPVRRRSRIVVRGNRGIKVVRAITIRKPAGALYAFWRDVSNLAQVIKHRVTITAVSPDESHWKVSAPLGHVQWDAVIINDEPPRLIAWRSREGSEVAHAGSVRFAPAPGGGGTKVTVALQYDPPGGRLGAAIANLTRDSAGAQVADALSRLKDLMEGREISPSKGQPARRTRKFG